MKKEEKDVSEKKQKREKYVAENRKQKKVKKEHVSIFKRISKYFNGVLKEVKRIRWTNKKDLVKYSIASVVFVLFFGLYFYAIDWIVLVVRSLAK